MRRTRARAIQPPGTGKPRPPGATVGRPSVIGLAGRQVPAPSNERHPCAHVEQPTREPCSRDPVAVAGEGHAGQESHV